MNKEEKIKMIVTGIKALALIVGAVGVFIYADAYAKSTALNSPAITITGIGKVIAKPDVARFSYSIKTEGGKDIAKAKKDNDDRSNKIVAFLKKQGVPKEDIKTTGYSMEPRYQSYACGNRGVVSIGLATSGGSAGAPTFGLAEPQPCPPADIVGYSFNNTVEVTVRDFEQKNLGTLLSGVVTNGANNVSQLRFELDDPAGARLLAKAEAIAKAKIEAKRLAKESGISLGRILAIDEYGSPIPMYAKSLGLGMGGDAMVAESAPAIEAGSQEIEVTVNVRYALK
ncbi:MAG: hypothetical protein UV64_C0008G0003 [Parcubacteria group bacterium GW2011_GWC1_43_11b]|uniref:DUF541 domain-containing protein n=1 Tax=Candidatus Vogelbacteria bacterium RIFOXYB1_FULL_42_16 TaxID=1802436 RepID=A0A1G2QEN0_9BACT|nr:MAG: hypothetical protein UV50_C0002G0026 [Parcubacteria group bacterium GW2011_GWB1_42_9]KKS89252.1 MAG: hypothetical protein UV64_C0008G0003 [Parcubacteria group bacterium GW2011_GWC1_43_11b]KKT10130.1 MAG: hypothetical protein UV88_C0001G0026 [Parcubacteria group bacterium GW2011_GWA1_43_21]OHA59036.1 MAG: hypothetical protein A2370_00755 [Candidatus Vogelbacteria bacterium RIFOXYB1_FULL_42_16]